MLSYLIENLHTQLLKFLALSITILVFTGIGYSQNFQAFAEEKTVSIPFGAYNPKLDTPADEWYSPSVITVNVGDTVTWINDDQEGHTVTSGMSSGRFGWMSDDFGTPDGFFDSGRFMPGKSGSYTFNQADTFRYFCVIHPWMEGAVVVEQKIPDYPHDYLGNKIEFPIDAKTADGSVLVGLTWDPPVLKTFEKIKFIYHFHDVGSEQRLLNQKYDIVLIQNGKEIFSDSGVTGPGGDFRNFIFKEPGDVIIRFKNIMSAGTSGLSGVATGEVKNLSVLQAEFSTIVYENPEGKITDEIVIQPAKRLAFQYELAVAIIVVPAILLLGIVLFMKRKKPTQFTRKASPI